MPFALDDLDSNCGRLERSRAIETEKLADLCEHGGICVGRHVDCIYRAEAAASHIEVRSVRNCQRKLVGCAAAGGDRATDENRIGGVGRRWNASLQLGIACQVVLSATSVSLPESIPSPRSPSPAAAPSTSDQPTSTPTAPALAPALAPAPAPASLTASIQTLIWSISFHSLSLFVHMNVLAVDPVPA
jgi:hypothetical protein